MFLSSWPFPAGVGALLLIGAFGWRCWHRARMRTRIAEALDHPDPRRRRAGVLVATEQGLRAHSDLLADHLNRERDPAVLDALVDAVLRTSWEPADQPALLALRLWAHQRRPALPAAAQRAELAAAAGDPLTDVIPVVAEPVALWPSDRATGATVPNPTPDPYAGDPRDNARRHRSSGGRGEAVAPDRRDRRAAARRAAAAAAVTATFHCTDGGIERPDEPEPLPIVPAPRRASTRSRARSTTPVEDRGRRDVEVHRPAVASPLRDRPLDDSRNGRRHCVEPRPGAAPGFWPEPERGGRGARHRAEPGQLRFVRRDG